MRILLVFNAALLSLALAFAFAKAQEADIDIGKTSGKLPREVVPHAYRIVLAPDLVRLSAATGRETVGFAGSVQIDIDVLHAVDAITVNVNDISIARATVNGGVSRVEVDSRSQTAKVTPPRPLDIGRHTLGIEYSGTILTHQEGLFYSTYDAPAGR